MKRLVLQPISRFDCSFIDNKLRLRLVPVGRLVIGRITDTLDFYPVGGLSICWIRDGLYVNKERKKNSGRGKGRLEICVEITREFVDLIDQNLD